jgi:hypothetical protein
MSRKYLKLSAWEKQRIAARRRDRIAFDSRPGNTHYLVFPPARPPKPPTAPISNFPTTANYCDSPTQPSTLVSAAARQPHPVEQLGPRPIDSDQVGEKDRGTPEEPGVCIGQAPVKSLRT